MDSDSERETPVRPSGWTSLPHPENAGEFISKNKDLGIIVTPCSPTTSRSTYNRLAGIARKARDYAVANSDYPDVAKEGTVLMSYGYPRVIYSEERKQMIVLGSYWKLGSSRPLCKALDPRVVYGFYLEISQRGDPGIPYPQKESNLWR